MKFNWGTGFVLVIALFIVAMVSFVIFASTFPINLVDKNYYEKGVDFDQVAEAARRSASYSGSVMIEETPDDIRVSLPAMSIDSAHVTFFRPSDYRLDQTYPIEAPYAGQRFSKENFTDGRYVAKIRWYSGGEMYKVEKTFTVSK